MTTWQLNIITTNFRLGHHEDFLSTRQNYVEVISPFCHQNPNVCDYMDTLVRPTVISYLPSLCMGSEFITGQIIHLIFEVLF